MKKFLIILFAVWIMMLPWYSCAAIGVNTEDFKVQLVSVSRIVQSVTLYGSLSEALQHAKNGDTIEIFEPVSINETIVIPENTRLTISSGVRRVKSGSTYTVWGRANFVDTVVETVHTVSCYGSSSAIILENGAKLFLKDLIFDGNGIQRTASCGGFSEVKSGAELSLEGVTVRNFVLAKQDTRGGAIYGDFTSKVYVYQSTFSGNTAASGQDIFSRYGQSLSKVSTVADVDYSFENTDINKNGKTDVCDLIALKKKAILPGSMLNAEDLIFFRQLLLKL